MSTQEININLASYKSVKSNVFTGRPQGLDVRKDLKLDELDKKSNTINLIIPADTTSFNPSFYLGLLFDSIKTVGVDNFSKRYHFVISSENLEIKANLMKNLDDGWRNALNSLNKNFGFDVFFNAAH